MTKILIIGNHCCSNRGDAAILRGLLDYLEEQFPSSEVDFTSRYIDGAQWFFKQKVLKDPLFNSTKNFTGISGRIKRALFNKIIFPLFASRKLKSTKFLPKAFEDFTNTISSYDLIIQVGGSFFVDLYGVGQFDAAAVCINAEKPVVMLGHSVGPFKLGNVDKVAASIFKNCNGLVLREKISEQHLLEIGVSDKHFTNGGDTAWLIASEKYKFEELKERYSKAFERPCIAITTRVLSPFDKRLGISQVEYEKKLANLCDWLISIGYNIVAASTCTGLDSYHRDDRMTALRVGNLVKSKAYFFTIMDELTDVQLGSLLRECELTIGTRLHSAILSMRFDTPAFAIYYEHKSLGILEQMGMKEYSVDIHKIDSEPFKELIKAKLNNINSEREIVKDKVSAEAEHCRNALSQVLTNYIS